VAETVGSAGDGAVARVNPTELRVLVRYFAAAAEASGSSEETVTLAVGQGAVPTLHSLRSLLENRYGEPMVKVLASGSFLVDGTVRRDPAFPLEPRDAPSRVDILPPFAGG
jgi:sulfur-carrier protein